MVLVLHPDPPVQDRAVERGHVPRRPDPGVVGLEGGVHDDPVVHLEPGRLGQGRVGRYPEPGHHAVDTEGLSILVLPADQELVAAPANRGDEGLRPHVDAPVPVVADQEPGKFPREDPPAEPLLREEDRHLLPVRPQGRGDLRSDESPPDDGEPARPGGRVPQSAEVVVGAEVVHLGHGVVQLPGTPPRGQEKTVVGEDGSPIVGERPLLPVEAHPPAPRMDIHAQVGRAPPDALLVAARPEALREGRAIVGGILLGRHEPHGARVVHAANPPRRRVRGHPAAHDEVSIVRHERSRPPPL